MSRPVLHQFWIVWGTVPLRGGAFVTRTPPATSSVPGGTTVWKTGKGFEDSSCVKVIRWKMFEICCLHFSLGDVGWVLLQCQGKQREHFIRAQPQAIQSSSHPEAGIRLAKKMQKQTSDKTRWIPLSTHQMLLTCWRWQQDHHLCIITARFVKRSEFWMSWLLQSLNLKAASNCSATDSRPKSRGRKLLGQGEMCIITIIVYC